MEQLHVIWNRSLATRPRATGSGRGLSFAGVTLLVVTALVAGCGGTASPSSTAAGPAAATPSAVAAGSATASSSPFSSGGTGGSTLTGTITAEFDAGLTFDSEAQGLAWWATVKKEFEAKYPNATLNLENTTGNLSAYTTKLALQFRNPSATPDVIQINSQYLGQFGPAGFLQPLNSYVSNGEIPGWDSYPANVKANDTINGQIFGIDEGENIGAIIYNKKLLAQAGITAPWTPKTWNDILTAASAVKAHVPGVSALGISAGTSTAAGGIAQGTGHLIYGTSQPTIYDTSSNKWVVDSTGIRDTLTFYKTLFGDGLGVPVSELFAPNAIAALPTLLSQGKLAIAIGENWYPGSFVIAGSGSTWPAATTDAGVAPIPTENGQAPGVASTLQAWAVAISKASKNYQLDLGLIQIMQSDANIVSIANTAGFVPPVPALAADPTFVNFAPLQGEIASYLPHAQALPSYQTGYSAWVSGMEQATGALASDPSGTSVSKAVSLLKSVVETQLGSGSTTTLP